MPFRRLKLRQLSMRILMALMMGCGILLLGGISVIWQTVTEIEQDAESRLQRAQLMFDRTLGYAQQAAMNVEKVIDVSEAEHVSSAYSRGIVSERSFNAHGVYFHCGSYIYYVRR